MKRPYSSESWERFKELNCKVTKRLSVTETRSQRNEDKLNNLEPRVEELETVNDMTTGINLIRKSRDWTEGSELATGVTLNYASGYSDGFYRRNQDGTTVLSDDTVPFPFLRIQSTLERSINSSLVFGIKPKETFTLSCRVRVNQSNVNSDKPRILIGVGTKGGTGRKMTLVSTLTEVIKDMQPNVWYDFTKTFTLIDDITENDFLFASWYAIAGADAGATYDITEPMLQKGAINHPVYDVSPSDLAFDPINDITTAPNLLRGSRDFTIGFGTGKWGSYTNGFNAQAPWTVDQQDGEFAIATLSDPSATINNLFSPAVYGIKSGEQYTISFEIKTPSPDITKATYIATANVYDSTATGATAGRKLFKDISFSAATGITAKGVAEPEPDVWYPARYVITIPDNLQGEYKDKFLNIYFRTATGATAREYSVRKVKIERGNIEHPEWTASPFDGVGLAQGSTGWSYGLNSGINIVPGTSNEWSEWIVPAYNINNATYVIQRVAYPEDKSLDDVYTALIEIEFDNVSRTEGQRFRFLPQGATVDKAGALKWGGGSIWNTGLFFFDDVVPESKVYRFNAVLTPTTRDTYISDDAIKFEVGVRMDYWGSGRFRYRCLKIERGCVEKPQWSPSPEDIMAINDITSGLNLLRGTRDGVLGTAPNKFSEITDRNFYTDGFREYETNRIETYKDEQGFTVFRLYQSGVTTTTNQVQLVTSAFFEKEANKEYTYFVDIMIDDTIGIEGDNLGYISQINKDRSVIVQQSIVALNGTPISKFEKNKWYTCVAHLTTAAPKDNWGLIFAVFQNPKNGSIHFKKAGIYEGYIKNPEWAPAPADLILAPINDITSGTNLVRSTRDFTDGSTEFGYYGAKLFKDGWNISPTYTKHVDENGFTVLRGSMTGATGNNAYTACASPLQGVRKGATYTISFKLMMENKDSYDESLILALNIYDQVPNRIQYEDCFLKRLPRERGGVEIIDLNTNKAISYEEIKEGEWVLIRKKFTVTVEEENSVFSPRLVLMRNGTLNFREFMVQEGDIHHPVWTANTFDYASSKVEDRSPLYIGTVSNANVIKSNADLNDYTTAGVYVIQTDSFTTTIKNRPNTNNAFKLIVEYALGSPAENEWFYCRQIAISYVNPVKSWMRIKRSHTLEWSNWEEVVFLNSNVPVSMGGTGGATVTAARNNLKISDVLGGDTITNIQDDTYDHWVDKPSGLYYFNQLRLYGQPCQWGLLYNMVHNKADITQFFITRASATAVQAPLAVRHVNEAHKGQKMPPFQEIRTVDDMPYVSGLYAGRSLSAKFSAEIGSNSIASWLSSKVSKADFTGLDIGDYVDILCEGNQSRRYVIAAFDPYYNVGSPTRMGHHILMVPKVPWALTSTRDGDYAVGTGNNYIKFMTTSTNNGTQTEQSPYMASNLHKWESEVAIKQFPQEWQDAMIDRLAYCETRYSASSALTNGTGFKWCNFGKLWSLSEFEMYGSNVYSASGGKGTDVKIELFNTSYLWKNTTLYSTVWLRNVADASSTHACSYDYLGSANRNPVDSVQMQPLPCFLLG